MTLRPGRRAVWWLGGGAAVLAGGLAIFEIAGWPFLRGPLQHAIAGAAQVPVLLEGRFRARFIWRPQLSVEHLNLGPGGGVQVPHLLDARGVQLDWRWGDVWRWHRGDVLRVHRLEADSLDARLLRTPDGHASWQLGGPPKQPRKEAAAPADAIPRFGVLLLREGHIALDDAPLDTHLTAEVRGGEGDALPDGSRPGYHATISGRYRALPMKLDLRTGGAMPLLQDDQHAPDAAGIALRVEGTAGAARLLFDGTAGALLSEQRLQGALRFSGPSLAQVAEPLGVTLPQTPPFELDGRLEHAGSVWRVLAQRAVIGSSLLNGDFRYDMGPRPAKLSGRLGGSRLALADLGPAVGAAPAASAASAAASREAGARVLPQRKFDLPSLRAMDADVQVAIAELDLGSAAIAPLKALQTRILLDAGVLQLQALKANVAGGQFGGSTRLDANADPAKWAADLRFSGVDIAGWLLAVQKDKPAQAAAAAGDRKGLKSQRDQARQGGDQPVNAYLTGALSGNFDATGAGRSTAEILGTLDGQAKVFLTDGSMSHLITELAGLDIAQALGVFIRGDRPMPLRCARLDLVLQHGVVLPREAVIDNSDSTIRVGGHIDLRDEALALQAVVKPKDFSPLTLRTPINVGGTLGSPKVSLNTKPLAGKLAGAAVLGAVVAPLAALVPLIDRGDREKTDPCAETPAARAKAAASAAAAQKPVAKAAR